MYTADQTIEHVQPKLRALLAHYKERTGCRVQALKKVAGKIGASEHWIRRVIGRYGEVTVQAHHFLNILREHVRLKRAERRKMRIGRFWPGKSDRIIPADNQVEA